LRQGKEQRRKRPSSLVESLLQVLVDAGDLRFEEYRQVDQIRYDADDYKRGDAQPIRPTVLVNVRGDSQEGYSRNVAESKEE
jgi:hypothetical protein